MKIKGKDLYEPLLFGENMLSTSSTTFRKSVIDKVGMFDEDKEKCHFAEDYDLWLRIAKKNCTFYFTNEILGEYIEHDTNYSQNLGRMLRSETYVLLKHFKYFEKKTPYYIYLMAKRMVILYLRTFKKWVSRPKHALRHTMFAPKALYPKNRGDTP